VARSTIHFDYMMGLHPYLRTMMDLPERKWDDAAYTFSLGILSAQHQLRSMMEYKHYGQQVFALGPLLQEMFQNTSLKTIRQEEIFLPYPAFYLSLEDCPLQIWGGERTQWHTVSGVYARRYSRTKSELIGGKEVQPHSEDGLMLFIWADVNKRSVGAGDDASFWFNLSLTEAFEEYDGMEDYIDKCLSDRSRDSSDPLLEGSLYQTGPDALLKKQNETVLNIIRMIVMLSHYLNTDNAETDVDDSSAQKRKALKRRLGGMKNKRKKRARRIIDEISRLSQASITRVGRKLEATIKKEIQETGGDHNVRRHWRRGHTHSYWKGPLLDDGGVKIPYEQWQYKRKLIAKWVPPTLINPDRTNKLQARIYEVEGPSKE